MKIIDQIFQLEEINGHNVCPTYLYRWTLLRVGKLFAIYLHKFVGDDWSTDLHDHPKRFWSIGLCGGYTEWTPCSGGACSAEHHAAGEKREWRAPWIRTFPAAHIHRLTGPTPENPCWTIVIVGKRVQEWGFWPKMTFVPWRKYVGSDDAKAAKSCP